MLRVAPQDSVPVAGASVVLHRVGRDLQGPIDSTTTDDVGRFRMSVTVDTTAVFILSASYAGIQYFSSPIHTNPGRPDTMIRLVVSDTASNTLVETASRHVVIGAPATDGTREVVDLVGIANRGLRTRVTGAEQRPTWATPLDPSMIGFHTGASDFSPEAVFYTGGVVEVFGPIAPGEKTLLMKYRIPADAMRWVLAFADTVFDFSLLIEDASPHVSGPLMDAPDSQVIAGRTFRTFRARPTAGDSITVAFPGAVRADGSTALVVLVILTGVALSVAGGVVWRRRTSTVHADEPVDVLVRRLAILDANVQGREPDTSSPEWQSYVERRAALKAQLARALARGSRPT